MNRKQILTILLIVSSVIYFTINSNKQMNKIENNYESLDNDPLKARIYTLDNGLKVYLTAYKDAPRVQTNIVVRAGSKHDPKNATGLAHYLEHMLFKGTTELGTVDYNKEKVYLDSIAFLYDNLSLTKSDDKRLEIQKKINELNSTLSYNIIFTL